MITSIMWVTLKEARWSFMGIDEDTVPEFDELMNCLDKKKEFMVLDLPAPLIKSHIGDKDGSAAGNQKGKMDNDGEGRCSSGQSRRSKAPRANTMIGQNEKNQRDVWCTNLGNGRISCFIVKAMCSIQYFSLQYLGQAVFLGQCYMCDCRFRHKRLQNKDVGCQNALYHHHKRSVN